MTRRSFFAGLLVPSPKPVKPLPPIPVAKIDLDPKAIARLVIPELYRLQRDNGVRLIP